MGNKVEYRERIGVDEKLQSRWPIFYKLMQIKLTDENITKPNSHITGAVCCGF